MDSTALGRRGYILYSDQAELKQYNQVIQFLEPQLERLQKLTVANVSQQQQLIKLRALINQRLRLGQQSINLHRQNASQEVQAKITAVSTRNRQEIYRLVTNMKQQEEKSLDRWVSESQSSIQLRMSLEFLGTFLTSLILSSIFALLYRQMVIRQQAEALQQKLAQEKELGELKLQFFSRVSHEFRTPLSSILGSAQILDDTLHPLVEKQKLKSLYRIRSAAQVMAQLLSDILALARADAGKLEFNPTLVEMQSFCLNLLDDMQPLSKPEHSIQFITQSECTYAHVDEKLLYSILSNLISNVIKYSPNGGLIAFTIDREPNFLTFRVRGIPSETKKICTNHSEGGRTLAAFWALDWD
ncbi:histidine kinase dimerization/phospho-acceptor domain-containing protein [Phormidium sp. FACHB-592]|nr:histidine kinase dimerization/phospho-acceptor domain-containing protein [Phormidium sp. FACHB-592]